MQVGERGAQASARTDTPGLSREAQWQHSTAQHSTTHAPALSPTLACAQDRRMMVSSVRTVTGSALTSWLLRRSA